MGRFITPDPFNIFALKKDRFNAWISNPQRWNKYTYALNNPTTLIDPDGLNACGAKDDSTCQVSIYIGDRSKDKNGNYNDAFKDVKNQDQYNAVAIVIVTNTETGRSTSGTFLAKTTPSDSDKYPTVAAGYYSGTLTTHSGQLAIRLQPTSHIPILNDKNPATGKPDAAGILIHISAANNLTGMVHNKSGNIVPTSAGCTVVCSSQYSSFERATGMIPSAGPPQQHFNIFMGTKANEETSFPYRDGPN
jgi:hypothetical protein